MIGFFLFIGQQGSGKTLMAVKSVIDEDRSRPIFSNCKLIGVDYTPVTFNSEIEKNRDKLDIIKKLDENPDYFNNSIMLIDEIHLYLDSYDFMKKNNRKMQTFFSQLRKRGILLLGTTQYLMNVDVRIRRQCLNVFEMEHRLRLSDANLFDDIKTLLEKGHNIKDIFHCIVHEIDGYFTKYLREYYIDLSEYYKNYDTNEVIL